ncbi:DNA gyrase inhibitor YacG [Dechloromonas sp. ZY10]|uniref:DNA gyrase inhibitor YacG n=1 Tax=Dechloromonas aquae TaxID=2664436 RepID=UPI0035271A1B
MSATPIKPRLVRCPQCGGESVWAPENRFRPFCSERCKQIDLGCWASDGYRIAGAAGDPADLPVGSAGTETPSR